MGSENSGKDTLGEKGGVKRDGDGTILFNKYSYFLINKHTRRISCDALASYYKYCGRETCLTGYKHRRRWTFVQGRASVLEGVFVIRDVERCIAIYRVVEE